MFSTTYTPQQAAFGIETLINLAAQMDTATTVHIVKVDRFSMDVSSTPLLVKQLFNTAFGNYQNHQTTLSAEFDKAVAVGMSLKIDSIVGSTAFFKAESIIGASNSCIRGRHGGEKSQNNVSCDGSPNNPFKAPDGFRMGWGDKQLQLIPYYDPTNCESVCGNLAACQLGTTTAWEEIQMALNARFPKPKSPDPSKPYFWGFSNIDSYKVSLDNMSPHIGSKCAIYSNRAIGYCMEHEELNCVYCAIFDGLWTKTFPYNLMPTNAYFISINIAATKCVCSETPECQKISVPFAEVKYGTPIFKKFPKITTPGGPHPGPTTIDPE